MPELGRAALVVCLGLSLYATVAGAIAAHERRRRLAVSAQNALIAALGAAVVASAVLLTALLRHDFSFTYVADHTSRKLPAFYTFSAFWGGQEGSLLLWLLVLLAYAAAAVYFNRVAAREVIAWVVPTLGVVASFFALLLVAVASPFQTQAAPADGLGLNPSLQNPYMVIHPPMLYLGYVGLTVPFAFAMGALLSGRTDERWIVATRRWTLAAWTFLGVGQLLGAHWAYVEVGWGGYYALGSGRERRADAVARRDGVPALGDGAGEEGDDEGLEHAARDPGVLPVALRHVPDALRDHQLDPLLHAELDRALVPRFHLPRHGRQPGARLLAAAPPPGEDEARVDRLPGGHVPLQQPASRRALPDDPLGRHLPAPDAGRARRVRDRRASVLRLLPSYLRAAAAPAHGHRAARRLAACLVELAPPDALDPRGRSARGSVCS